MTPEVVAALPAAPEPEPLRPVAASERAFVIDAVRGLALFGILAANIRGFAGPAESYFMPHLFWPAVHDRIAQAFVDTFISGKFITIFAVLFGVGFAVQLERASARRGRFGWTYARRLFVLLLFGLLHGLLIWFGDILLVYALTGFALLLFRKRRDRTVAVWAAIALLILPLFMTAGYVAWRSGVPPPKLPIPTSAELAALRDTFANGSWLEIQRQRMKDAVAQNWMFFPILFWHVLGLFLLGVLAWRKRFFQPKAESLPKYRRAMWWGLAIGISGNVATTALRWAFDPPPIPTTTPALAIILISTAAVPALSLAYVCLVILLCHYERWRIRFRSFAAIGRTALSNYLLQSVVGTLLFYSYGLGLFGTVGPAVLLVPTFLIFGLQAKASSWWLERYRFGPVEWLWRRLTYGRGLAATT